MKISTLKLKNELAIKEEVVINVRPEKDFRMTTQDNKISIVYQSVEAGFEKDKPILWLLWDYSLGWLLAFWILVKSMWKIWTVVPVDKAIEIWQNPKTRKKHIRKGREKLRGMKTTLFNRWSPLLRHFCQNVTNAAALDDVYNSNRDFHWQNGEPIIPLSAEVDPITHFYLDCPNGQAVRNRCRGVENQFKKAVKEVLSRKEKIRVLSIACGSAQALIRQIALMTTDGIGIDKLKLTLTDMSKESLAFAKTRARQGNILDRVRFIQTPLQNVTEVLIGGKYDIIEACGIADYLPDKYMLALFGLVYSLLDDGGHFITSNMNKTRAARILTWTYNWEILYRSPEELARALLAADFQKTEVFIEPWHIHAYAVAQKGF